MDTGGLNVANPADPDPKDIVVFLFQKVSKSDNFLLYLFCINPLSHLKKEIKIENEFFLPNVYTNNTFLLKIHFCSKNNKYEINMLKTISYIKENILYTSEEN